MAVLRMVGHREDAMLVAGHQRAWEDLVHRGDELFRLLFGGLAMLDEIPR
jgi:hypothetical protein